jgi:hypothetical protein
MTTVMSTTHAQTTKVNLGKNAVSLTPVINLLALCWTLVMYSIFICEILSEFSRNFEMALMRLSGAWEKMIHEKTETILFLLHIQ